MAFGRHRERSPLHPNALRLAELTPGLEIVVFNRHSGILNRSVVVETPHLVKTTFPPYATVHAIKLRSANGDEESIEFAADIGLIPYGKRWNTANFTIRASDSELLPEVEPPTKRRNKRKF